MARGITLHITDTALRRFFAALFVLNALFIGVTALADLQFPLALNSLAQQLDLKQEVNLAVWYSSLLLLLAGIGAWAVSQVALERSGRWMAGLWKLAALVFFWISMDETAQIHEKAGVWFTVHLGRLPDLTQGGYGVFAWLLIALPFALVFIVCILRVARWSVALHARSQTLMWAATACWIVVLGAEFVQAQLVRWSLDRGLQGAVEEGLEIMGSTLFLLAFAGLLRAAGRPRSITQAHADAN